jgi:hypothetical protein
MSLTIKLTVRELGSSNAFHHAASCAHERSAITQQPMHVRRVRSLSRPSAHYYCMILELQHLIGALTSFGPAADYPDSGDASATHSHFGHPFETLRIGDSRCADHGAIDPNSWSRTVPKSVGTDEAIAALFPSQYLMHSKTDTQ